MTRREFIGAALAYGAAFALGAVGGCADRRESGRRESSEETEPP